MENRGKDSVWEVWALSTCSMNAQNLPRFLKFTDQMENRGKAGIWELRVLAACGPNSKILNSEFIKTQQSLS